MTQDTQPDTGPDQEDLPLLTAPHEGIPTVTADPAGLAALARRFAAGTGPLSVDTERAQGFRYSGRAYLIQVRREGAGTALIDPIPLAGDPGFAAFREGVGDAEWIIHAASQDLPCLVDLGLRPTKLFDTELAARLLGHARVGLGPLVEELLGVRLLKEHSAADWSTRPLPTDWLAYAALDVELLVELRDLLAAELVAAGKQDWAAQESAWWLEWADRGPQPRVDPWRRTSGMHLVRSGLGAAIVRELWQTRDEIGRRLDRAPSRILNDHAITDLAHVVRNGPLVPSRDLLHGVAMFNRREARRQESSWLEALARVAAMAKTDYPPAHTPPNGPPPPRTWGQKDPAAAARWEAVRGPLNDLAEQLHLPPENLISPDPLRRVLWQPAGTDAEVLDAQLAAMDVRPWQRELTVPVILSGVLADPPGQGEPH